jgi:hypothetical protein
VITFSIDSARQRLHTWVEGRVTYHEILDHLEMEREAEGLPLAELIDATRASMVLSQAEVGLLVEHMRELGRRHALGPAAMVVGDELAYGLMRMLDIQLEGICEFQPFRSRAEAEAWLDALPAPRPPTDPG